ncbi:hypothetical protein HBI71_003930 [Parastagonospora nodorum]|nr:hypothetical protein HBI71_003930 [Parastagonospora nodorum]KAH5425039.1 hypothetical protein HBI47_125280 [Parastagonospora nodorum]
MSANRHRVRILLGLLATLGLLVTFSSHGAERICPSALSHPPPKRSLSRTITMCHNTYLPICLHSTPRPRLPHHLHPTLPYPTLHTPTTPPQIRHSHPSSSHLTHNVRIRPK